MIVVHGGAWAIPDGVVEEHLRGVREAQAKGWSILDKGGSALDAVEETVISFPCEGGCGGIGCGCRACRELYLIVLAQYASICLTSASGSAT